MRDLQDGQVFFVGSPYYMLLRRRFRVNAKVLERRRGAPGVQLPAHFPPFVFIMSCLVACMNAGQPAICGRASEQASQPRRGVRVVRDPCHVLMFGAPNLSRPQGWAKFLSPNEAGTQIPHDKRPVQTPNPVDNLCA